MTDIPIIFSGPMVRALLEGRKTMTRRLARTERKIPGPGSLGGDSDRIERPSLWQKVKAGDRLWVRENFLPFDRDHVIGGIRYAYGADTILGSESDKIRKDYRYKWKPSIYMPREVSRLTLIVTGVKTERLQDIGKEDAIAEGASCRPRCNGFRSAHNGWSMDWSRVGQFSEFATGGPGPLQERDIALGDAQSAFGAFINMLHGGQRWNMPGKPMPLWDQNPFVVALSFRVIKANIDAPEARAA
jgi:hypothetical protein